MQKQSLFNKWNNWHLVKTTGYLVQENKSKHWPATSTKLNSKMDNGSGIQSLTHIWFFGTPWTVACQASLSIGFFRQEYWSGLPFPSPGDLPDPGIKPRSSALQADSLLLSHTHTHTHTFVVVQSISHVWLCNLMDNIMPGSSVLHYLPEFAQIHVQWVSDTL